MSYQVGDNAGEHRSSSENGAKLFHNGLTHPNLNRRDPENRRTMKTIGLIGGMSWESTIPYYRIINEEVRERAGGLHSAKIVLYSVDFHDMERLQYAGNWDQAGKLLGNIAVSLESAGADFIVLCTNTMHKVASEIESAVAIPLLHIADTTGKQVIRAGCRTVGLLGTRFTMEQDFYRQRLHDKYGLQVVIPEEADRQIIHRVIYEELCLGKVSASSRDEYCRIIGELVRRGAQAVILGCTEISLLIGQGDCPVTLFDTMSIHARSAAEMAILDSPAP